MRAVSLRRSRAGALVLAAALLCVLMSASGAVASGNPVGTVIQNITYCMDAGAAQKLDLYYPTIQTSGPMPIVLWIHGGTWEEGDKSGAAADRNAVALRGRGFMVAGINYSLAPAHPFPAQIQDLTCGVRFLRHSAGKYGINPNEIGAFGVSAGGHLAAMLGVDNGSSMFIDGGYPHVSSNVEAVAALWGVHDLTLHDLASYDEDQLPSIFGPKSRWASESPITYVRSGLPPFLLVHGRQDADVPFVQSRDMLWALKAKGVPYRWIPVDHAGHGLQAAGGDPNPSKQQVATDVAYFFKERLSR